MSEKKQSLAKLVAFVVAALAGAGGADAAGYTFDPSSLERLGVLGSLILIGYFEYRVLPLVLPGLKRIAEAEAAPAAEATPEPAPVIEQPKKRATHPQLVAIKPHKEST